MRRAIIKTKTMMMMMMMYNRASWLAVCALVVVASGDRARASEDRPQDGGSVRFPSNLSERCTEYEQRVGCEQMPICFCDDLCDIFGDCCSSDARDQEGELALSLSQNSTEDGSGSDLTTDEWSRGDYYKCVALPSSLTKHRLGHLLRGAEYELPYGYWMVGRCPPSWGDVITRQLCEAPADESDLMVHLPVVSSDDTMTSFRNIYCAMCHGVSPTKLTSWQVNTNASIVVALNRTNSLSGLLEVLNSSKGFHRQHVTNFDYAEVRGCLENVIDSCPAGYGDEGTVESCRSHMAAVVHPTTGVIYRNWHCALCNDAIDPDLNICETFRRFPPIVFSISLTAFVDFEGSTLSLESALEKFKVHKEIRNACDRGEFLDPFSLRCRALLCPGGGRLLENGVCDGQNPPKRPTGVTGRDCTDPGYVELEVDMCLTDNSAGPCELWTGCVGVHTSPETSTLSNTRCETQDRGDFSFDLKGTPHCASLERIRHTVNATVQELDDALAKTLAAGLDERCPSVTFIPRVVVKKGCLPAPEAKCLDEQVTSEGSVYLTLWNKTETLYFRDLNTLYSLEDTLYQVTYSQGHEGPQTTHNITICGTPINLNCSLVAVNDTEFLQLFETRGEILTDDNHVRIESGGALLCHDLVSRFFPVEPQSISGVTIVTLIGIIISMLALTASFATYLVFPSLRNLPGKCVMSLIVAVFTSQLLFLITGDDVARSVSEASCTALAVLLHYTCLSTFSWTNALALYLARTLGPGAKPSAASQHRNSFLYFSLFGWGAPLVIVLICLILHFVPGVGISYGVSVAGMGLRSCSIAQREVEIAAFVAPISVSLMANVALFAMILAGFTFRRAPSANLYSKEARTIRVRRDAFISIKIGFLLAFTWIFGFLATGLGSEALLYVFCILTPLQGVYIFLAFTFTKQVRALWRERLGLKPPESTSRNKRAQAAPGKYFQRPKKAVSSTGDKNNLCRKHSPSEHQTGDSARDGMAREAEMV